MKPMDAFCRRKGAEHAVIHACCFVILMSLVRSSLITQNFLEDFMEGNSQKRPVISLQRGREISLGAYETFLLRYFSGKSSFVVQE